MDKDKSIEVTEKMIDDGIVTFMSCELCDMDVREMIKRVFVSMFSACELHLIWSEKQHTYVKCNSCGWIHVGITLPEFSCMPRMHCFRCGEPNTNFSPATAEDAPPLSNIQTILLPDSHGVFLDE